MEKSQTISSSFGELLKTCRKRKRLTQRQLAQRLDVHANTVSSWELGTYLPATRGLVLELARHLELDEPGTRQLLEASLTALPPYWHVPFLRNPFFTGSEKILEVLHTRLGSDQVGALTRSSALHGLGGVGKTQIALEYAYRHALEYSAVFWIGAEIDEQVISSFWQIAESLQLPERAEKDQGALVTAVKRWLSTHSQWLLIWDNLEDLALLDRFLPSARSGAILLTTRLQAFGTLARGLDLFPMAQEEGLLFLLRRAKVLEPGAPDEQMRQFSARLPVQYAAAVDLVTIMGRLPLALDQAGAYIEETGCSLTGYLHSYEREHVRLLDRRGEAGSAHPHSVTATFLLTMERVEREHSLAANILRVCTLLHADAIPEELFVEGAAYLGPELACLSADPTQFDAALAFLRRLSLVQRYSETRMLSLHRLVQAVLKGYLSEAVQRTWRARVLWALSQLFPSNEGTQARYWQTCERLLPHALVFLTPDDQESEEQVPRITLMSHVATYLSERSCYREAEQLFQRTIHLGEQAPGGDHPQMGKAFHGLALLFWRQGKHAEAERLFQRAIHLGEQASAPDPFQVCEALYRLASLYRDQGKYTEAEPLFQRAISLGEQTLGGDHPQVATSLQGLAVLYAEQWKYARAEPLYQRALHIREQALGPDHPQVAALFHNPI